MLVISIKQPWIWAIIYAGKWIENRSTPPPKKIIGHRIALHASRIANRLAFQTLRERGLLPPDDLPLGAILATATVVKCVTSSESPWFTGPYGWVLDQVRRVTPPFPCKGRQWLWHAPNGFKP